MIKILNEEEKELNIGQKIVNIMSYLEPSLWNEAEGFVESYLDESTIIENDNDAIIAINGLRKEHQKDLYNKIHKLITPLSPEELKEYLMGKINEDMEFIVAEKISSLESLNDSPNKSSFEIKIKNEVIKIDIYNI
jgi:hypothetical protein